MSSSSAHTKKKGNTRKGKNKQVLTLSPLNSVPYFGSSVSANKSTENAPADQLRQKFEDIVGQTHQFGVTVTASAALKETGPRIGLVDIAESDDSYFFRVSLPGVSRDENEFTCDVEADGKVVIKGVTTTGEKTVCRNSQVFHMLTQNFCPPGPFTIEFQLPGPVKNEDFVGNFGSCVGVLEGHVKKLNLSLLEDTDSLESM